MPIALHSRYIFGEGGWLKHKDMAIVTCSDGIKPVTFKLKATDIDVYALEEDTLNK